MTRWLRIGMFALSVMIVTVVVGLIAYRLFLRGTSESNTLIRDYLTGETSRDVLMNTGYLRCENAPFILPSEGLIGLLYADTAGPYNTLRRHTGIDIFGNGEAGTIPIVAVYDGFLTRLPEWKSTVIIRHDDPLQPGRTIWTYYTHMASRDGNESYIATDFPSGTYAQFVKQGTPLGFQGEFAGDAPPIAMHLHFSIVESDDNGAFLNEAILENTLDPSPYFGMKLNLADNPPRPIACN